MRKIGNVTAFYSYRDPFSNHFLCRFKVKDTWFNCAEQFLMYCKAMYFDDVETAKEILAEPSPQKQKMLGRKVSPFDEDKWAMMRARFYFVGLREKYSQHPPLKALLMATGDDILVEASKRDTIWGVGLDENDDRIADPLQWQGDNLCGYSHMDVRHYFRNQNERTSVSA